MMRRILFAITVLAATISTAHAADEQAVEIVIQEHAFHPAALTVHKGTKVVWINRDEYPHSIEGLSSQFHSPDFETGESFTLITDHVGKISYQCGVHPLMKGSIEVTQ